MKNAKLHIIIKIKQLDEQNAMINNLQERKILIAFKQLLFLMTLIYRDVEECEILAHLGCHH